MRKRNEALDLWVYALAICEAIGFGPKGRMTWDAPPAWALPIAGGGNSELCTPDDRREERKAVQAITRNTPPPDDGWSFDRRH
jgi:phage terminase large subunit GpA-like protein